MELLVEICAYFELHEGVIFIFEIILLGLILEYFILEFLIHKILFKNYTKV